LPLHRHRQDCFRQRDACPISDASGRLIRQSSQDESGAGLARRSESSLFVEPNVSDIVLEPSIAMGDFFVLQPNGADFDVIGRIRMGDK
jgi:hypothetical protein